MANFTIDDAFEMSLEESGSKYGALHFGGDPEIQQSRLKYKNLENDEDTEKAKETERGLPPLSFRSSQCSFSTISNSTQLSYRECFSVCICWGGVTGDLINRCLECDILCAWIPAADPGSISRDIYILRGAREARLPVLLPPIFRQVTFDLQNFSPPNLGVLKTVNSKTLRKPLGH
ncbi:transmembrane protein 134 isoform X1 [Ascaphus truei]|uniref:transmembrane protein 134 isoform X1 n=1 Tax=Ascaphus truei TaxID=8439 RepID=UPI003F5933DA